MREKLPCINSMNTSCNIVAGLSIVICTWNRAESLRVTLGSLNEQLPCDSHSIEVLVIDNNSSDHTKQVVDEALGTWRFGTLRYAFESRQGKQFALNHGINLCTYDVIAFTDDDIIFINDWARIIIQIFTVSPVELVGGKTLLTWPTLGTPNWYHPSMSSILAGVDLGDEKMKPPSMAYAPAGSNMIVRHSLFDRIGGFSETHYRHMDFEFGMRSQRKKALISYEPSLVVFAPVDAACLTKRYFRRWSFKAGIARDDSPVTESVLLAVPRWVYRQIVQDIAYLVFSLFTASKSDRFYRELQLYRGVGKIASRWHEKLFPQSHTQWIANFSQKKKNVY